MIPAVGLHRASSQASFLTMGPGGLSLYTCKGSDLHLAIGARGGEEKKKKGGEGQELISKVKQVVRR